MPHSSKVCQGDNRDFRNRTGLTININSALRTPYAQAQAMYTKFELGAPNDYKNKSAYDQIRIEYEANKDLGVSESETVNNMSAVISDQVKNNIFISSHLTGYAVDIRTINLDSGQRYILNDVSHNYANVVHPEGHPVHLHLEFPQ